MDDFPVLRYPPHKSRNGLHISYSEKEIRIDNAASMQEFEIDWKGLGISPPIPEKQIKPLDKAIRIVKRRLVIGHPIKGPKK